MPAEPRRVLLALAAAAVLGAAVVVALRRAPAPAPKAGPAVIALFLDERVRGALDPMGVRVAEVSVDADGAASLVRASEQNDALQAALAELRDAPGLPLASEGTQAAPEGGEAHTFAADDIGPDDPRYPWALGAYLRKKTGLRYRVEPGPPK